jgi:NADPH2:quinone reductase
VKVLTSTINPADLLFIGGRYRFKPEYPQTAGLEGAGIVESGGEHVCTPPGAMVAFLYKNTWAEYVVLPEAELYVLPRGFPQDKAAQFALNPVTAWGLLEESGTVAGDWLLLTAGSSAVAKIVTQIAKHRGIHVILAVRKIEQAAALRTLGADEVVDLQDSRWPDRVMEITGGRGVACAMDPIGGKTGMELLPLAGVNGRLIIYGALSPDKVTFHYSDITYRQLTVKGFGVRNFIQQQSPEERRQMVDSLVMLLVQEHFQLPVFARYAPENIKEAIESATKNAGEGKTLLSFE